MKNLYDDFSVLLVRILLAKTTKNKKKTAMSAIAAVPRAPSKQVMYLCIYLCMHALCMHVCMYECMYVCVHVQMCVCVCVCVCVYA